MLLSEQALLVYIIESGKFPSASGLREMIKNYFISGRIRTGNAVLFRVFRIHLRPGFLKALGGICLFAENLTIAPAQLGLVLDSGYAVRHFERKL
jgi:hypothetical protein